MLIIVLDWRIRSSTVRAIGPTLPCPGYPPSIDQGVGAHAHLDALETFHRPSLATDWPPPADGL
jgi:hypothetical protein